MRYRSIITFVFVCGVFGLACATNSDPLAHPPKAVQLTVLEGRVAVRVVGQMTREETYVDGGTTPATAQDSAKATRRTTVAPGTQTIDQSLNLTAGQSFGHVLLASESLTFTLKALDGDQSAKVRLSGDGKDREYEVGGGLLGRVLSIYN